MVGWERHLQCILRHAGKRYQQNRTVPFNSLFHSKATSVPGEAPYLPRLQNALSPCISRPWYQYLQHLALSSSRTLLAESSADATPSSSPLTPMLTSGTGSTEAEKAISKPSKVQAVLKGIKQSPKKVNLVAALVRGMRVEDALLQLQVTVKRAAKTVYQDDAINRRADEVAEWLHSAIDILPPHGESTDKIHFGIPDAFANSIREEDYHKYYEPRVVSIGPFHHGKPHLARMENFKRQAVRILAEGTEVSIEQAYATVEQDLLRIAKECYDVSRWDGISDPDWCLMMFLDGCFVVLFLSDYVKFIDFACDGRVLFCIMTKHDRDLVRRDLLLLENQLPFKVLRVLVGAFGLESIFNFGRLLSLFLLMSLMTVSYDVASKLVDCYTADSYSPAPVHLLQNCRDILVGVLLEEEDREEKEEKEDLAVRPSFSVIDLAVRPSFSVIDLAISPSFSVTELKKVGIRCSYAMDRDYKFRYIDFESSILSGHLFLPQLTINEWTVTLFSNLLAYEDSCSMLRKSTAITSYLSFMCMLINGEEDVKELRARGILNVNFKDDEKLINFLRDMTAHTHSDHKVIREVKQRISAFRESKRLPLRIVHAVLEQRYFSDPWSFLAVLTIFTVIMTVIQTVFTGIQTYK